MRLNSYEELEKALLSFGYKDYTTGDFSGLTNKSDWSIGFGYDKNLYIKPKNFRPGIIIHSSNKKEYIDNEICLDLDTSILTINNEIALKLRCD